MSKTDPKIEGPILPRSMRTLLHAPQQAPSIHRRHAGLQLDKFSVLLLDAKSEGIMKQQGEALLKVTKTNGDEELLQSLLARRERALEYLGATCLGMTTRGSLTLHLSRPGTWENAGICLHPVYGFTFLPGSGIKGMIRAWAETVWAGSQADPVDAWRQIEEIFGFSLNSESHKFAQPRRGPPGWRPRAAAAQEGSASGRLVFHDAWPKQWPRLMRDVVNNHHPEYYRGKNDPGDWENPTLMYFLAIGAGTEFQFAISDRNPSDDGSLELACGWLRDALVVEGAGAKTSSGYGRFKLTSGRAPAISQSVISSTFELRLVTPAFLAGANQEKDDCTLRAATLRGLLRWWWRTMYAARVDRETLRQLEAAVWGDTNTGSPVRIAVDYVSGDRPVEHPDKRSKRSKQFLRQHGIRMGAGGRRKWSPGLFYASYGMAEKGRKRWFRPPGNTWRVTLATRKGQFQERASLPAQELTRQATPTASERGESPHVTSLPAQELTRQATAALWLLTRYGGAGSRSRKGFGSFEDVSVSSVNSIEDCKDEAARFLRVCGLTARTGNSVDAPALDHALIIKDRLTKWYDPWYAMNQIGEIIQGGAKNLERRSRVVLGLPRFDEGADKRYSGGVARHSSPVLWSLTQGEDGALVVRVIAFPAARLPSEPKSREILQDFVGDADRALADRATKGLPPKQRIHGETDGKRSLVKQTPGGSEPENRHAVIPKPSDRVMAEILPTKTKKGGWKAKHLGSKLEGPIQDSQKVPASTKPGQELELTVVHATDSAIAFKWEPPAPPRPHRSKGGGSTSRKRERRGRR